MTIQLICDLCRTPKDEIEHYSLIRHQTKAESADGRRGRRQYAGSIDLCEDCMGRVTHDGRDSAHKQLAHANKTRLEMGERRR